MYLRNKYLIPTHYALRNYSNGHIWYIQGWNLEGKCNNNDKWEIIDEKRVIYFI